MKYGAKMQKCYTLISLCFALYLAAVYRDIRTPCPCNKLSYHSPVFNILRSSDVTDPLGYNNKSTILRVVIAGGQRQQFVAILGGKAGIVDRRSLHLIHILVKCFFIREIGIRIINNPSLMYSEKKLMRYIYSCLRPQISLYLAAIFSLIGISLHSSMQYT